MASFDLASDAFFDDPYPTYRQMRAEQPAYQCPKTNLWFVSRHRDVADALAKPDLFSSSAGNALSDSPLRVGKTLGSIDPPRHDELRRIIIRGVTPARIELVLPWIRAELARRLDVLSPHRQCDFVADISRPLLFGALGRMLGLGPGSARKASDLSERLFRGQAGPAGPALADEDRAEVVVLLTEELARRRLERDDDLFSVLIAAQAAGAPLGDAEIVANMMTVLLAGNASIGHFLPNLMHALWRHPGQRLRVMADLSLVDAAIEEAVRWDTSTQCFARTTSAPAEIAGVDIPPGARVALLYASANRDETAIGYAERFDLTRGKVRHFGFGFGPHICLGASATRAILRTILPSLLAALREFDIDIARAERVRHLMVRGFRSLPIIW
ncbi:cytochrome P450 [Bradyrhizobium manausense]|uniref:cytochrome P450 n=1 Tax=Bradyrhizobium TaxID=374 RepID=UPI001BAD7BA7|nr:MULTISPECIES: cytochrome P450 [Bradyrhizobium]MBR0827197.1 cytochrome P450 [Bradyrhizobium manausense]UVO27022.1 cytochrome P450 [Bradyrhizobium arachidis]